MEVKVVVAEGRATIGLAGRFDFSVHRRFREAYTPVLEATEVCELEIDLGAVDYLDSSALGMLLMLREKAQAVDKTVTLANCRGAVRQVLDIANFAKLFNLK